MAAAVTIAFCKAESIPIIKTELLLGRALRVDLSINSILTSFRFPNIWP